MPIPENEYGLPLVEAIQKATGRRPHISTAIRWCQRCNRYGIRLESWMLGGRRVTSVEAVQRYNERNTTAANHGVTEHVSRRRSNSHAAAVHELDREFGPVD